jgi:isopentenyl diphosphate isomerase/L-lactate dehydrogenase-like FMN-dependent dehydrogenase
MAAFDVIRGQATFAQGTVAKPAKGVSGGTEKKPLALQDVLKVAREKLYPLCRVCPECDGVACAGEVPGFGGVVTGLSFKNNYNALARIQLNMRVVHDIKKPDTSVTIFGEKLSIPILGAPIGEAKLNFRERMSEDDFDEAMLGGCLAAGTLGMIGDSSLDPMNLNEARLKKLSGYNGKGIAIIKPRPQEEIIKRIRMAESVGAVAVGTDIDSCGRGALPGWSLEPKTLTQLRELTRATKLPFLVKGIMTPEEAEMAVDAGAAAIVVSNHGGRVLDHTPGVADVLGPIAQKVKGKLVILADGGIRYGDDVLKLLALGADAVLVGRPLIRGVFGGGKEGVAVILNRMKIELIMSMILTGTRRVMGVPRKIIV